MSEHLFRFLEEVMQRRLGPGLASCPPMRQLELELAAHRRWPSPRSRARAVATEWGHAEGNADVTVDCLLITPRGLIYAAALRDPAAARPCRFRYRASPR